VARRFSRLRTISAFEMPEKGHWSGAGPAERQYRTYSCLMLAARTTLPHFSVSSAISFPKSAGDPGSGVPPSSANLALIFGSARMALISLLSPLTISDGVFYGAPMPTAHFIAWHEFTQCRYVRQASVNALPWSLPTHVVRLL
jgi:hypothetical protein